MTAFCLLPFVTGLMLVDKPTANRLLLSIAPGAVATIRHVKIAGGGFFEARVGGRTFTTARLRLRIVGRGTIDLDAVEEGVRYELADGAVAISSEKTIWGGRKKKENKRVGKQKGRELN